MKRKIFYVFTLNRRQTARLQISHVTITYSNTCMYLDLLFLLVGMYVLDQSVMSSEGGTYSTISYSTVVRPNPKSRKNVYKN